MNQLPIRQYASCTEIRDILEAYLAGEFDADTRATIARHIASCPNCQEEVRFSEVVSEALRELPRPEPPPKIFNEVSAYVRAHPERGQKWMHRIFQRLAFSEGLPLQFVRAGALVCLVGIALLGIYQYQHHGTVAKASRDLNYAFSKLQYAVERVDLVVNEKLPNMRIDAVSHHSFAIIEEASHRISEQKIGISSAIHKSLETFNQLSQIISDTKHHEDSHQKGNIP